MNDEPLERKQVGDVAVYATSPNTSNPNVKKRVGSKTIVPAGSPQDNALNPADASLPQVKDNRYTSLLRNQGDDNAGS